MKLSKLTLAITTTVAMIGTVHAAGLERSQQPIAPLFEKGNYAEISYAYVNPDIKAKDMKKQETNDMIDEYGFAGAAVKVAPTENTALALFYNHPWAVDTTYPKGNMFNNELGTTEAHVDSDALGLVIGGKPKGGNVTLYGGVEYQKVSGHVSAATPLSRESAIKGALEEYKPLLTREMIESALAKDKKGEALNPIEQQIVSGMKKAVDSATFYDLEFEDETTLVPMLGIAYEKPEIALRTSVTYRAPAKYDIKGKESLSSAADPRANVADYPGLTEVKFPQSVSVDFQTGLSEKHQLLGMINARWVDWSNFEVAPPLSTAQTGEPLASYEDDQYSVEVALAKQFTPKLAAEVRASYDYAGGKKAPLSLLGPYGTVKGLALGAQYDVTDKLTVGGGAQYMWVDGGTVPNEESPNAPLITVEDSTAYALGMKVGYKF